MYFLSAVPEFIANNGLIFFIVAAVLLVVVIVLIVVLVSTRGKGGDSDIRVEADEVDEEPDDNDSDYEYVNKKDNAALTLNVKYDRMKQSWIIVRSDTHRVVRRIKTKQEAVAVGKQLAASYDANLRIHKKDGKFQKVN